MTTRILRLTLLALLASTPALAGGAGAPAKAALTPTGITTAPALEVWEGQYVCSQGPTGVRLSITEWSTDRFRAMGEMFPLPSNPKVPRGQAELWGTYDTAKGLVNLTNYRWVVQPAGYVLAPLSAKLTLSADFRQATLQLNPPNYGCTEATLKRVR